MEEKKPNIKQEIQEDPFFDSKSPPLSVELKTENTPHFPCPETSLSFEENIDSDLHEIGMPSIVECDLNAYLSGSETEKKVIRRTRPKKVVAPESTDNYFSSDTEVVKKKKGKKTKKKQPVQRTKKEYKCAFCEKVCRSNSDKIKHERVHTGGIFFKIIFCGYFSYLCVIFVSGETPYSCSMCDKSFKQSSYLLKHERNHTGERPYKWVRADPTSNVFIKQEIVRTPFSHICEECDKAFNTATELKQHMRR